MREPFLCTEARKGNVLTVRALLEQGYTTTAKDAVRGLPARAARPTRGQRGAVPLDASPRHRNCPGPYAMRSMESAWAGPWPRERIPLITQRHSQHPAPLGRLRGLRSRHPHPPGAWRLLQCSEPSEISPPPAAAAAAVPRASAAPSPAPAPADSGGPAPSSGALPRCTSPCAKAMLRWSRSCSRTRTPSSWISTSPRTCVAGPALLPLCHWPR